MHSNSLQRQQTWIRAPFATHRLYHGHKSKILHSSLCSKSLTIHDFIILFTGPHIPPASSSAMEASLWHRHGNTSKAAYMLGDS